MRAVFLINGSQTQLTLEVTNVGGYVQGRVEEHLTLWGNHVGLDFVFIEEEREKIPT